MRVLHVVATANRRGAEVFASDLIRALNETGIGQQVAVIRDGAGLGFDAPTLILADHERRVSLLGVEPRRLRRLRKLAARFRPDLIQAHGGEALKYALGAGRIPVVYRRIGVAPAWILRGPRRRVHAALMRRAARVVAVAEAVRRETVEVFAVPPRHVVTIPNGVDSGRMQPSKSRAQIRRELGFSADAPVLLSLGALSWEKDPLAQLKVSAKVLELHPDTKHLFVGDGPMRDEIAAAVRKRGLGEAVRILGARDDVADLLEASDVVVFASRSRAMEGMPGVLIEAGMAGVPVVAYAVAGVPEVIDHRKTGLLASPGDVEELASRVGELIGDAGERRALGSAAQRFCLARFEIGAISSQYRRLYEEIAAS